MLNKITSNLERALVDSEYWDILRSSERDELDQLLQDSEHIGVYELHLLYMLKRFRNMPLPRAVLNRIASLSEDELQSAREEYLRRYRERILS